MNGLISVSPTARPSHSLRQPLWKLISMAGCSKPSSSAREDPSPRHPPAAEAAGSRVAQPTRGASKKTRAHPDKPKRASSAEDRDAQRRLKALEKHFSKAMKQVEASKLPLPSLEEEPTPQSDHSSVAIEVCQNWSPDNAT